MLEGWYLSLKAEIGAWRMELGLGGWNWGLEAGIAAGRLELELGD